MKAFKFNKKWVKICYICKVKFKSSILLNLKKHFMTDNIKSDKLSGRCRRCEAFLRKSRPKSLEKITKIKARSILNNLIQRNKIRKPLKCSVCKIKSKRIEGHHENYNKPLDVIWLCVSCHLKTHEDKNYGRTPNSKEQDRRVIRST